MVEGQRGKSSSGKLKGLELYAIEKSRSGSDMMETFMTFWGLAGLVSDGSRVSSRG